MTLHQVNVVPMKFLDTPRSGSYQSITASRNRYGQYLRSRATPVNPRSSAQGAARGRLSANAAAWRGLTSAQRAGWGALASQMSRTDALGTGYVLNAFGAFLSVNNNLLLVGSARVSDAPALVTPSTPDSVTLTLTASAFSVAYTPTPLGAGTRLLAYASPQRSSGRSFEGDLRFTLASTAAQASPLVLTTAYAARFGTPIAGNRVFCSFHTMVAGFRSGPLAISQVVA